MTSHFLSPPCCKHFGNPVILTVASRCDGEKLVVVEGLCLSGRAKMSVVIAVSRFSFYTSSVRYIPINFWYVIFAIPRSLATYGIIICVPLDNLYNFRNAAVSPYPNAAAALPVQYSKI